MVERGPIAPSMLASGCVLTSGLCGQTVSRETVRRAANSDPRGEDDALRPTQSEAEAAARQAECAGTAASTVSRETSAHKCSLRSTSVRPSRTSLCSRPQGRGSRHVWPVAYALPMGSPRFGTSSPSGVGVKRHVPCVRLAQGIPSRGLGESHVSRETYGWAREWRSIELALCGQPGKVATRVEPRFSRSDASFRCQTEV